MVRSFLLIHQFIDMMEEFIYIRVDFRIIESKACREGQRAVKLAVLIEDLAAAVQLLHFLFCPPVYCFQNQ